MIRQAQDKTVLVRYGQVPEVAKFHAADDLALQRGEDVVVQTHRGLQVGEVLEVVVRSTEEKPNAELLRKATVDDEQQVRTHRQRCDADFDAWCERIAKWNLDLQLLDLEWTLDGEKLIFYVLNERGPDCTKLALQAAAGGFGIIEVQPVDSSGIVQMPNAAGGG